MDSEMEDLLGRVEALVEQDRGFVSKLRGLSTPSRWLIATASVVLLVGIVFGVVRRSDLDQCPPWQLALLAMSYIAPLSFLVGRILSPLHQVEAQLKQLAAVTYLAFCAPFVWAFFPPHGAHMVGDGMGRHDCLLLGFVVGAMVIGLLRVLDRAPDADRPRVAMAAAAGGLVANLALVLHCPGIKPLHLAIAHAPIGLLLLASYRRVATRLSPPPIRRGH
jgi:hypothetical protein